MNRPVQPSGDNVTLRHGPWEATVTEVGAGLRTVTHAGTAKIAGYAADEQATGGRGQVLMPWPNRIEDGAYDWAGTTQQLPLSEPARHNASHGLTRWVAWRLAERAATTCTWTYPLRPQPGYPHALDLQVTYALGDDGLQVEMQATNVGSTEAPYACGAHPFLTVGRRVDECELVLPAGQVCDVSDRGLPGDPHDVDPAYDFRSGRLVGDLRIDHPYTALEGDAVVCLTDPATGRTAELWADDTCPWRQVFTGDTLSSGARESVAVEPMTAPANAFRTGRDLVTLAPGESHVVTWGIR